MYWWVWTSYQSRPVVFSPPYASEEEANQYGFQKFGSSFEVIDLNTKDKREAAKAIKRTIFERTSNLEIALRRAKHDSFEGD